jgi:uncharacterized protein
MNSDLLWMLILSDIVLGGFDTLYHHEFTERLAWRASQRFELRLHAIRNFFYAVVFILLGCFEVHGTFAVALLVILVVEVIVTLYDFVEEDMSRKLPATERITHTLLGINYGAILVLVVPVLLTWSGLPSAIVGAWYGWWSVLAIFAALAVAVFGLRDALASRRCLRLETRPAAPLMDGLVPGQRVLVTGATGFIGRRVVAALVARGHHVTALVRDPNPVTLLDRPLLLITSLDQIDTKTRIDAIINLAGEPIANALWTDAKRASVVRSRLVMTDAVVGLIARLVVKPSVLINGSAIGWYGLWQDEVLDEASPGHDCFSRELCVAWEGAARKAEAFGVRVVLLRLGLVLGTEGGMLTQLLTPFEFGLGGPMGSGAQWMSWITRDDVVRLIALAMAQPEISGPLNATAPYPVTNADFTRVLGRSLNRPAVMRVRAAPLALIGGDLARELLLGGQKVLPRKALASGFVFEHPELPGALAAILGAEPRSALDLPTSLPLATP